MEVATVLDLIARSKPLNQSFAMLKR